MNTETTTNAAKAPTLADATKARDAARIALQSAEAAHASAKAEADAAQARFIATGADADDTAAEKARARAAKAERAYGRAAAVLEQAQRTVDELQRACDEAQLREDEWLASVRALIDADREDDEEIIAAERRIAAAVRRKEARCAAQNAAARRVIELRAHLGIGGIPPRLRSLAWSRDLMNVRIARVRAAEGRGVEGVLAGDGWTDGIASPPPHGTPERARFDELAAIVDREFNPPNEKE